MTLCVTVWHDKEFSLDIIFLTKSKVARMNVWTVYVRTVVAQIRVTR